MQTVSVTIDRFVEQKFEKLLNEHGYEYHKQDTPPAEADYLVSSSPVDRHAHQVSFVLTSEEEFDLVELGILNECARQIQQLEDLDVHNYKSLVSNHNQRIQDRSLLDTHPSKRSSN